MRITVVTLNYNGSKETIELLKSLQKQTNTDFEIIVIDNASKEADFKSLQNQLIHITPSDGVSPQVKVVRNSQNLGFSGGNNIGIHQALENSSDWVVLLNNDTWVERDFIERLWGVLGDKKGVVGIPLVEGDRTAYVGKIQWLKPTLKHVPSITRQALRNERLKQNLTTYYSLLTTHYAIGGAMAIQKDVFEKIGLLDEKYFLYFEDADFSIRAKKAGFEISVADDLSVHHHVSSSTKKLGSSLLLRYHYRNALYFNLKNGPWYIKLLVWPWSLLILAKQTFKIVSGKNIEESKAILAGIFDFYRKRMGKIKTKT